MSASAEEVRDSFNPNDDEQAFERGWTRWGFPTIKRPNGVKITPPRQRALEHEQTRERFRNFWMYATAKQMQETADEDDHDFQKFVKGMDQELEQRDHHVVKNVMDTGDLGVGGTNITPLVFDPEVLSILKEETPFLDRVPEEGQEGFKAVYNRIDSRDSPIGYVSESTSADLRSETASGHGYVRGETEMEIWVDKADITDFANIGASHYLNLRDTTLGERVLEHAQQKEKTILYGDSSQGNSGGDPGDTNAYDGLKKILEDQGEDVAKGSADISGTDGLLRDIKAEVKTMLQSNKAVNKSDLELWTSHTLFDTLENEMEVRARVSQDVDNVNFGFSGLSISGIPVIPSHNVTSHSFDGSYSPGSEGDVFIVNRREIRYRSLMPLSTVPLGRQGWSEQVALGEFGSLIMRGEGKLSRYLKNYGI